MSDNLYTIKPLEWESDIDCEDQPYYWTKTPFGFLSAFSEFCTIDDGELDLDYVEIDDGFTNPEDSKAAAEKWYVREVEKLLVYKGKSV